MSRQLRDLRGCYGVYVSLFQAEFTLRGPYGTFLRGGMTVALYGYFVVLKIYQIFFVLCCMSQMQYAAVKPSFKGPLKYKCMLTSVEIY